MQKPTIKMMKVADLAAAPYNPRKISPKALKGLEASLREFGMVEPVIWNKRTRHLVGGHQRVRALKSLGKTQTPVVVVVDLDEKREKALNATLNNPLIQGEFTDDLQGLVSDLAKQLPALYRNLRIDALEAKEKKTRSADGEIAFTQELMEAHNFVVLYADNEIDWLHVQTLFPLPRVKALDAKEGYEKIGIGRVIKAVDFIKAIQDAAK